MNQIPNIEETYNTREVEEVVKEFYKIFDTDNLWQGEDEWTKNVPIGNIEQWLRTTLHHQLQKAREQRKGWKGYVAVDPKADNYKYSPVFSDRKGAELWVKGKEISGLKVVEVDILLVDHSELDQAEPEGGLVDNK